MPYDNIAVALANKEDEKPVVDEAIRISQALGAKLYAIHVNDPLDGKITMMMERTGQKDTEEDIRYLINNLGYPEVAQSIGVKILTGENFAEAIEDATREADLLVLGHRKMGKLRALFTDSMDETMANLVECPVLVVTKNPKQKS